ncbi:putative zinc-binding metallopeptidase [Variovorax sp. J22R133]|uniref:zinc-binding metallopeptidase family protein n=1 Tax=Variovorax brevis TaxID=3053503 RepID=UPI002575CB36|nr:putative zinc-binding metallopeptidase [Variovorax sp. J22R133]MDM0117262.1 putative zinc-binding metallopeptidase [Variovorax sp. J22R133]
MSALLVPAVSRAYKCPCRRPIFLRNTQCVNCGSQLGYETERLTLVALIPGSEPHLWCVATDATGSEYQCCANRQGAAACNWLVKVDSGAKSSATVEVQCLACRLNRHMFDVSQPRNWHRARELEAAKRRLLTQLLALGLPVEARQDGEKTGIAFDMLEQMPNSKPILTGHQDDIITINVAEADDAQREAIRAAMHEPYRTLLGHFRHEIGHYYWDRLVRDDASRLAQFRSLFGNEQADYGKSLQKHYRDGPQRLWAHQYISSYASTHPWEDWAETWAHYLHITDTVDTAASFRIDSDQAESESQPFEAAHLWRADLPGAQKFLELLNAWVGLTQVMNELARSMGQADVYPFIVPYRAVAKLQFIHETVAAWSAGTGRALNVWRKDGRMLFTQMRRLTWAPQGYTSTTAASYP